MNFTKMLTTITLLSLLTLLSGCSFDQRYRYQVNGTEDYLHTPALKPIQVPKGLTLPPADNQYNIGSVPQQGNTGLNVDIFPPSLPLATLAGSIVDYRRGIATLDISANSAIWARINTLLRQHTIPIVSKRNNEIITGPVVTTISAHMDPFTATYRIYTKKEGSQQQQVGIQLISLFMGKKNISADNLYKQRYTVNFFNWILLELKKNQVSSKPNPTQN